MNKEININKLINNLKHKYIYIYINIYICM